MRQKNQQGTLGTILWLAFSLAIGFLVWEGIANRDSFYKTYLVQSGSMEPAIMVGDVIIINKSDSYLKNDVITFNDNIDKRVTHRITDAKREAWGFIYTTKGDANRSGDREVVPESKVLGKVILVIPKLGYLINFLKTKFGFVLFIILPAAYIVLTEIFSLKDKKRS